jgi:hypothetical protein
LALGTNSSERIRIDSSGNVGIGTSSPTTALEVIGDIKIKEASSYSNYALIDATEALLTLETYSVNTASFPADIIFKPAGTEKMRITDDGNVGIGTTSPQVTLDVAGSSTNGKSLQVRSGDVSVGTDSAQIIFSYGGNSWNSNGYAHSIRTRHNSAAAATNAIDFYIWTPSDSANVLGTNRVMTIDGAGNVGIGTASPSTPLEVNVTGNNTVFSLTRDTGTNGELTVDFQNADAKQVAQNVYALDLPGN